MKSDHYSILGIAHTADYDEIKKAYRAQARKWHPDRNKDNIDEAKERFQAVAAAYDVLKDKDKRTAYDGDLRRGDTSSGYTFPFNYHRNTPSYSSSSGPFYRPWTHNGQKPPRSSRPFPGYPFPPPPPPSRDEYHDGYRTRYHYKHRSTSNNDDRNSRDHSNKKNANNNSSNNTSHNSSNNTNHSSSNNTNHSSNNNTDHNSSNNTDHNNSNNTDHNSSNNTDHNSSNNTNSQNASNNIPHSIPKSVKRKLVVSLEDLYTGATKRLKVKRQAPAEIETEKIVEVVIKPGSYAGTEITLQNEGEITDDGRRQDIDFVLEEKPHDLYTREGDNLHVTLTLDLSDALIGFTKVINALDQSTLTLTSDSVIQHGQKVRLNRRGMPNPETGRKGDLFICYHILLPATLSTSQKLKIMEALG